MEIVKRSGFCMLDFKSNDLTIQTLGGVNIERTNESGHFMSLKKTQTKSKRDDVQLKQWFSHRKHKLYEVQLKFLSSGNPNTTESIADKRDFND